MSQLESSLIDTNSHLWNQPQAGLSGSNSRANALIERVQSGELLRIVGPCALDSVAQIEDLLTVVEGNVDAVRAPGKKPRTRPVSATGERLFEGIGLENAIAIYQEILGRHPQVVFATETMSGDDLLQVGESVGLAWIGSRTQQQETCRSVGEAALEMQLPVMVKNPMSADLELFLGMIENTIIGSELSVPMLICLRGTLPTTAEERQEWRNVPNLHWLPILHEAFPLLPIIIDPSHMLPKKQTTPTAVFEIVNRAVNEGADGYIVELNTPNHPSKTDPGVDAETMLNLLAQKHLA